MKRIIAMIPTYNEADNIEALVREVLAQDPRLEALVVDDDSPDGTWRLVLQLSSQDPRVHLLHRTARRGRGWAGVAGFARALELGADAVVEMDGDYSHHPRELPALIAALERCDVVLGSRHLAGGSDGRPGHLRKVVTWLAGRYVRAVLGLSVSDPTSGYRAFRRQVLARLDLSRMGSAGPSTLQEVLVACQRQGARIAEVPIRFDDRRAGSSKLSLPTMARMLYLMPMIRLGLVRRRGSG